MPRTRPGQGSHSRIDDAKIRLRLLDKYSNVACTNDSLEFGLTKGKWELKEHKDEESQVKTKQSERFDGRWSTANTRFHTVPKQADDTAVPLDGTE